MEGDEDAYGDLVSKGGTVLAGPVTGMFDSGVLPGLPAVGVSSRTLLRGRVDLQGEKVTVSVRFQACRVQKAG